MKKKLITFAGIVVVIILIVICVKYFRGGTLSAQNVASGDEAFLETDEADKKAPAQSGAPDEASQKLAEALKGETGEDYDVKNIVSVGKPIREGKFSYKVTSWNVTKEYPGYALPEGNTPLSEYPGAEVDENGNITNDFSYVVVNVEVENLKDEDITTLVWGFFRLGIIGGGDYTGESTYLGEEHPRAAGKDYLKETIPAKGKVDIALIFVVKDEVLKSQQYYLKINSSGSSNVNPDYDVRRFITLN